jgi:hypothetical protein
LAISEQQRTDLEAALGSAFNYEGLEQMFQKRLSRRLDTLVPQKGFALVVSELLGITEREGWTRLLVRGAAGFRPGNEELRKFIQANREFDRILEPAEVTRLTDGIAEAYPSYEPLRAMISGRLQQDSNQIARADPEDPAWATAVVPRLILWFDDRDRVEQLIQAATEASPHPALSAIGREILTAVRRRKNRTVEIQPLDEFEACYLDGKVFINRRPLRDALRLLANTAVTRVIAVNGPSRSGKTYSYELMSHLSAKLNKFEIATVDLVDETHAKFRPNFLARSTVRQMGRNASVVSIPKEEDSSTPTRWIRDLCDWLVGEVKDHGKPVLVVLDGFRHPDLPQETREMVKELVNRAATGPVSLRVALLDYSDELLPPLAAERTRKEIITALTKKDIGDFFKKLAQALGAAADQADLDAIADDVWNGVPQGDPNHAEKISKRVIQWVQRLMQPEQGGPGE